MEMNSLMNGVANDYSRRAQPIEKTATDKAAASVRQAEAPQKVRKAEQPLVNLEFNGDEETQQTLEKIVGKEKEPAMSTIDSSISSLNARISKTRCAYSYDEDTKRITIKVYDSDSDELIREVPPEKSLEALKKVWELAGIIIDQKG